MKNFKIGQVCFHPVFGVCKIVLFDKSRNMIQVRWPENSSSQAFFSLVTPETLKAVSNDK